MLKILIICQSQFGYHIDTYQYCQYLRDRHEITYLCWDYRRPRQNLDKIAVSYVSKKGNILSRNARYIKACIDFLRSNTIDVCFIKYFRGCSIVKLLFPKIPFVLDIRSGSVAENKLKRIIYDSGMRLESFFFKHVTIISKSLSRKLYLGKKAKILPLGSIPMCNKKKNFKTIDLIYVGTLENRDIDKTIIGFAGFLKKTSPSVTCSYTVIGTGCKGEEEQLRTMLAAYGIKNNVRIAGYIPFSKLPKYFERANIGVSFVPITPYFDVQPVTKTFDYLLSGMPVIATATLENKCVINKNNGILIDDTAESFQDGVIRILEMMQNFSSEIIKNHSQQYHWQYIIRDLEQYMLGIVKKNA